MRAFGIGVGAVFVALALASGAQGAVTVGSDMQGGPTFYNVACGTGPCTSVIRELSAPLAVTSPIDGVIVRWRFAQGNNPTAADVSLRVVHPLQSMPAVTWTGVRTGPTQHVPAAPTSFTADTRVPISVGDGIGLDYPADHGVIATAEDVAASNANFNSLLANGTTRDWDNAVGGELMLNVDVEADADHDGYGDETQDLCPSNAAFHTACPVPPKKKCKKKRKHHSAGAAKKKHCKKKKKRS
jgi:hypothetical protein